MEWPSGSGSGASRDTKGDPPGTCNIVIEKWEGSPEARERFKTHFKIRDVTKFEKVLNRFCERRKLDVETQHLAISLDGEHIDGAVELSCCADDYDLRDGAILYACDGNVKHQRMSSLRCGRRYGGEKTAAAREADGRDSAEKPKKAHADENADVINADEESIIVALPSHLALALRADEELGAQTAAGAAMPYAGVSYTALLDLYAPKQAPLASG